MKTCPNCGDYLEHQLNDGVLFCFKCRQIVNSSLFNKLLSAAWQVRKERIAYDQMKSRLQIDEDFCVLIDCFINDWGYNHDEFFKLLKKLNVSEKV